MSTYIVPQASKPLDPELAAWLDFATVSERSTAYVPTPADWAEYSRHRDDTERREREREEADFWGRGPRR